MNFDSGSQAGFALVAAAFMTGIWAWIAQKAKSKSEAEKLDINLEIQDRQNLFENYRNFNIQLQSRVTSLTEEVTKLWNNIAELSKAVDQCEKSRIDDTRHILELELSVRTLTVKIEESEDVRQTLERENSRLYKQLLERE